MMGYCHKLGVVLTNSSGALYFVPVRFKGGWIGLGLGLIAVLGLAHHISYNLIVIRLPFVFIRLKHYNLFTTSCQFILLHVDGCSKMKNIDLGFRIKYTTN